MSVIIAAINLMSWSLLSCQTAESVERFPLPWRGVECDKIYGCCCLTVG